MIIKLHAAFVGTEAILRAAPLALKPYVIGRVRRNQAFADTHPKSDGCKPKLPKLPAALSRSMKSYSIDARNTLSVNAQSVAKVDAEYRVQTP